MEEIQLEESAGLIRRLNTPFSPVYANDAPFLPFDVDVSLDNSNTMKEGVSKTYKGCDGYAPMLAYLGQEGYCVNAKLREGSIHSQNGTPEFLQKSIELARRMTDQPLLVRMDSGYDSADNIGIKVCFQNKVDFLIKRNPRKKTTEDWLAIAQTEGTCHEDFLWPASSIPNICCLMPLRLMTRQPKRLSRVLVQKIGYLYFTQTR